MRKPRVSPTVNTLQPVRRILGSVLDAVFTVAIMALLYGLIGYPLILKNNGYYETTAERKAFIEDPGLLSVNERGQYSYLEFRDYDENVDVFGYKTYEKITWEYFTVFLPAHPDYEFAPAKFGKTQGEKLTPFDSSKREDAAYVGQWTYENFFKGDYYVAATDGEGNPIYTATPVLNEKTAAALASDKLQTARILRGFFNSYQTEKGAYIEAAKNLIAQPKIPVYDNLISQKQWLATIPSIVIAPILLYFVLPLVLPNGRSLGKIIVSGAVLNEQGFTARRSQIALRQAIPLALWMLLLIPMIYVGVMAFLFAIALLYIFVVMSPLKQGLGDRLAKTIVVNAKTSIWFRSEADLEAYIESHPNSLVAKSNNKDKQDHKYAPTKEEYGILDSSMIGQARESAKTIESFDEFESREDKREPIDADSLPKKPATESIEEPKPEENASTLDDEETRFTDDKPQ